MPIERVVDGDSQVVLDDRLSPILVATWFGSPTRTTIDAFLLWVDRRITLARPQGRKLVLINDSIDSDRTGADARRQFTAHQFDDQVLVAAPTVITNPLVRGAITAVGWMLGERMKNVTIWKSLPDAFEHARKALREAGAAPPSPLRINTYVRPDRELLGSSHP